MRHGYSKLTDLAAKQAPAKGKPYRLYDGGGLCLLVLPTGKKKWHFRYTYNQKHNEISFGSYPTVSITTARKNLREAKGLLAEGQDPSQQRKLTKIKRQISATNSFEVVAREWQEKRKAKWKPDYAATIMRRLELHVFPLIGKRPIDAIETLELMRVLEAVDKKGNLVLAGMLRRYITNIMIFGVQTNRLKYNPALNLHGAIATPKTTHRPALELEELPELIQKILTYSKTPTVKNALHFALLTGARSSEFRFARWKEFDLQKKEWTIPPEREKVGNVKHSERGEKMHTPRIVPLALQTITLINSQHRLTGNKEFVFESEYKPSVPISENTPNKALHAMGYSTRKDICLHGFRTMAISALCESGIWNTDAVERQMGHQERNAVRAAYTHKAKFLQERRNMLQWWSDYLDALAIGKFISPADFKN